MRGFWTGAEASGTAGGRQTSRDPGSPWGEIEQVREGEAEGGETGLDSVLDTRYSESTLTGISLSVSDHLPLDWDFSPQTSPHKARTVLSIYGWWVAGKRGKGHEERDVLSESGRGKQLGTERWKTVGANMKGQKPAEEWWE